jgi:putative transcriptional regulator
VLRAEAGWSQAQLAERLGVSRQTVNAIETGRYDPSLPLAFTISAVFELPIEELFFPDSLDSSSRQASGSAAHPSDEPYDNRAGDPASSARRSASASSSSPADSATAN